MRCCICYINNRDSYRICNCNEALVCRSCLNNLNFHNFTKCPICNLELQFIYQNKIFKSILLYIAYILGLLFLIFHEIGLVEFEMYNRPNQNLSISFYESIKNNPNTNILIVNDFRSLCHNKIFMRILVYSGVFIIQPILFYVIGENFMHRNSIINNYIKAYYISSIGLNLLGYLVAFKSHQEKNYVLFTIIVLINYYIPLIIYSYDCLDKNIRKLININKKYFFDKYIRYMRINLTQV